MRTGARSKPGLLAVLALALCGALPAPAAVSVLLGPTPIEGGDARAAGDITVSNEKLAFALAVQSAAPYGVPRGALVDLAPVSAGRIGRDRVVFADFIPNAWSAWPNSYRKTDILERGPEQAVIRTVRDWGAVAITTVYTLRSGSDQIHIQVTMSNGGKEPLPGLLSGLTLWPNSGYRLAVPGLAGVEDGAAAAALSDRVVAYDEGWMIALHAPYLTHIAHGSRDLYCLHTLLPGESRSFEGWLQVGSRGDLAAVVRAEIERRHLPAGIVRGAVTSREGKTVAAPVVVIEKSGQPYAWTLGHGGAYELALPAGDYTLYATARNLRESARVPVSIAAGQTQTRDLHGLEGPGRIRFGVTEARSGQWLDARIAIGEGQKPLVEFLGRKTFFTELAPKGRVDLEIAPGHYVFAVSSGEGFLGPARNVALEVVAGRTQSAQVTLQRRFDPAARGWYSADLHHHADQAEAVTPPADLARSELAAGLDVLFVSDHDSLVNHPPLRSIARRRHMPFIPGVELSPSWGHFNAYPIDAGQHLAIDTSTASVAEIFSEARRLGAGIVQVNHPLIPYGYFSSLAAGVAPGGFNPGFDLIEVNSTEQATDAAVFQRLGELWNAGHRYYLSAGSDTHDVWNGRSGKIRIYAQVAGPLSAAAYIAALKAGHAYVSYGPLVYPSVGFGDTLRLKPGQSFALDFELQAVDGLGNAQLIGGGAVVATRSFDAGTMQARVKFPLHAGEAAWYALVVEDAGGHKAYTNPVWIETAAQPQAKR